MGTQLRDERGCQRLLTKLGCPSLAAREAGKHSILDGYAATPSHTGSGYSRGKDSDVGTDDGSSCCRSGMSPPCARKPGFPPHPHLLPPPLTSTRLRFRGELPAACTSLHCHTGVDVASMLLKFAQELKGTTQHVTMISLGQGRAVEAEDLVADALAKAEQWVLLQNCHLAASFWPRLCTIVDS